MGLLCILSYLLFLDIFLLSYCAEFNVSFDSTGNLFIQYPYYDNDDTLRCYKHNKSIFSGYHKLNGIVTIPNMFVKSSLSKRRRLKETPETTKNILPTSAPTTNKLMLPVVVLIHPEGIYIYI